MGTGPDGAGPCGWPGAGDAVCGVPAWLEPDEDGWQLTDKALLGEGSPFGPVAAECGPPTAPPPGCVVPPPLRVPPPTTVGVPFTSVPAASGPVAPVSTFELAAMIAWRNGGTASETPAMTAIPARTATGRIQLTAAGRAVPPGGGRLRNLGHGTAAGQARCGRQAHGRCQSQCPRHVQYRTRSPAPASTLSSHGRGGRVLVLARIFSSPSAPGSTWSAAAESALRSAASSPRSSSGAVIVSPASPPRHHDVSCCRIDLSAAMARAVWLLTAPLLIPIALAMSASDRSA